MSEKEWADLREERIRIEDTLIIDPAVFIHGSGGDIQGVQADLSYHVVKNGVEHVYLITVERVWG